jgi:hypothetical protein
LPLEIVPVPLLTVHVCVGFAGCVATATLYALALACEANVTEPLPAMARLSAPLFVSAKPEPARPETVAVTVNEVGPGAGPGELLPPPQAVSAAAATDDNNNVRIAILIINKLRAIDCLDIVSICAASPV